jgi:plastocyanin
MTTYDANNSVSRRAFVGAAAGGAALGATGAAAGQQEGNGTTEGGNGTTEGGGGTTDGGDGGTTTGEGGGGGGGGTEEVTVAPGGDLAFEPSDLEITPGTTVNFVWDGDNHNIVPDGIPEDAEWEGTEGGGGTTYNTGHEYSHTFEVEGDYDYYCAPHLSAGMEGAITVSADAGGGASRPQISNSALTLGVATTGVLFSTLALAFFFLKYGGDYGSAE